MLEELKEKFWRKVQYTGYIELHAKNLNFRAEIEAAAAYEKVLPLIVIRKT